MRPRIVWLTALLLIGFMGLNASYAQEVENLLANGGFEDGVETPWGTWGDVTTEVVEELKNAAVREDPIEGNFCLHVVVPAPPANYWDVGLYPSGVIFGQGKKYTFSAFLKIGTDYAEVDSAAGGARQGPATYDPGTLI